MPLPPWDCGPIRCLRSRGPLTLEADRNLPLWVRVRVPASQPRGTYHGTITLQADDYRAEIPLQVDVFGFALPDQMQCQTAFGFDTDPVWRYHGLKTEDDQRVVLDKYLQCLADHHISPYEPAPSTRSVLPGRTCLPGLVVKWIRKRPTPAAPRCSLPTSRRRPT